MEILKRQKILEFNKIQSIVDYAKSLINKKKIKFSLTTNATLLTSEIAEFFYDNNFNILVSLDGPKEIHDEYRKDKNDNGSFDRTIKGLKKRRQL